MLESDFQSKLVKKLKETLPGCIVIKNDPSYIQGIPDLTILFKDKWATLECKRSKDARRRPNQEYYVNMMDRMSFSAVIFPENRDEIIGRLVEFFGE